MAKRRFSHLTDGIYVGFRQRNLLYYKYDMHCAVATSCRGRLSGGYDIIIVVHHNII